jgi:hypothetical protein
LKRSLRSSPSGNESQANLRGMALKTRGQDGRLHNAR